MKKYFYITIAALTLAACGEKKAEQTETSVTSEKPQVRIAKVSSDDIAQTESYTAIVESDIKNNISPNTPLRIERIMVEVGDIVTKGQPVVQLDASNLKQLKIQIDNQTVEFNRSKSLYEVGGASKAEYDNAKMQLDILQTQYRHLTENTQLVSPISGVVTARNYDNGDMYSGQPILTIEQTNPVKLKINVSENHYKEVKKGDNVSIKLDAYEGEDFTGKITIVYPSVDQTTHTFPVEITINNPQQKVRPGMFARAEISYGTANHVLVPDEALVKQIGAGDRYVYVYNKADGTVSYNKVELGKHFAEEKSYEILSGVNTGDEVVIAGQARLANGREVEVIK